MIRRTTLKRIAPVLLMLLLLLDAHATKFMMAVTNNAYVANAHLALLVLLVIFPVLVLLFYLFQKVIQQNVLTMFFTLVISVTVFEFASLLLQSVFGLTGISSDFFVPRYLGPTLLFNIIMFVILIFPLEKILIGPAE